MTNFEIGPCSLAEYDEGKENPLKQHDLSPHTLYTWMILHDEGAAKHPSRVMDIEPRDGGLYVVRFAVLDAIRTIANSDSVFEEGIYQEEEDGSRLIMYTDYGQVMVEEGYFKDSESLAAFAGVGAIAEDVTAEAAPPQELELPQERELVLAQCP